MPVLSLDDIRDIAPAALATQPCTEASSNYRMVQGLSVIYFLGAHGFVPVKVKQQRVHKPEHEGFQPYEITFHRKSHLDTPVSGIYPEMQLYFYSSANRQTSYAFGTTAYVKVCENGMHLTIHTDTARSRHSGADKWKYMGMTAINNILAEEHKIQKMMDYQIPLAKQIDLANYAIGLRWKKKDDILFQPADLLKGDHPEQDEPTIWNVVNRIQSNMVNGFSFKYMKYDTYNNHFDTKEGKIAKLGQLARVRKMNAGLYREATSLLPTV